ncbi:hypothetical protein HNY73_010485 [Argiope bruennichi]|uniref:Uncharacterized protein n=1 Tax=Argiope bruennichi TaxID=94029 RepID=A0A8T0F217_ARGBR|nr:hypothetical protein HNY73_010485 [Argiope bruennichi]
METSARKRYKGRRVAKDLAALPNRYLVFLAKEGLAKSGSRKLISDTNSRQSKLFQRMVILKYARQELIFQECSRAFDMCLDR